MPPSELISIVPLVVVLYIGQGNFTAEAKWCTFEMGNSADKASYCHRGNPREPDTQVTIEATKRAFSHA